MTISNTRTAYELMARFEEIARAKPDEYMALLREAKGISDELEAYYGIWRGQDENAKFVWYNHDERIITKEDSGDK